MRSAVTENRRKKLIQLIHIGKGKLGMDDEAYRVFLDGVCGRDSAEKMTVRQLEQALKAMRGSGFNQKPRRVRPEEKGGASLAQLEYIKGMWAVCARNKNETALLAFVKQVTGIESLRFLDAKTAQKVILALRDMMEKAGFNPDTSDRMPGEAVNGQV